MYIPLFDIYPWINMFDRILIATDNSPLMTNAIRYTATLFPYSDYHLINVINTSDGSIPQTNLMKKKIKSVSKEALKNGKQILNKMGITDIKTNISSGTPSVEILRYINKHKIDLLVMATHSKVGAQKVHIGETALQSLQVTTIPSLIFACSCAPKVPEKIFNPTTFSTYSIDATMIALELASYFGASLTTYHIGKIEPGASARRLEKRAKKAGVEYELIIAGDVSDETIMETARGYDFMVGSRGRGGLKYKLRHIFPTLALSSLEKELIADTEIPFLMVGD